MSAVTETERYDPTVDGPQTGTPRTAASVRTGITNLANRAKWHLARMGDFLGIAKDVTNVDAGTNTLTVTAHGWSAAQPVRFSVVGGTLPAGLSASAVVYVRNPATDTFEVSATAGGAAIDITSVGSGTIYVWPVVDAAAGLYAPASGVFPAGSLRATLDHIGSTFVKLVSLGLNTIDAGWSSGPPAIGVQAQANVVAWTNLGTGIAVTNIVAGQKILFLAKTRSKCDLDSSRLSFKIGDAPNSIAVDGTLTTVPHTGEYRDSEMFGVWTAPADEASRTFYVMYYNSAGTVVHAEVVSLLAFRLG